MRITIFAAGSQGDIEPCLRLAKGLQQSGMHVLLAAPQDFAELIQTQGIAFHPLRGDVQKIICPHIMRAVNKITGWEIHNEIRAFQANPTESWKAKFIAWFVLLPPYLKRISLWILFKNPHWLKEMNGTVSLTSVGMFGKGCGWGIPVSNHTLQITQGGIAERPALLNGQVENHKYLCVTISFDHDIIDGAPAARFVQSLKEMLESQSIIAELTA